MKFKALFFFLLFSSILFSKIGSVLEKIELNINQPYGLLKDGDNLLISDRETSYIFYFSIGDKKIIKKEKIPVKKLLGIAKDKEGFWIIDGATKKILYFKENEKKIIKILEDLEVEPLAISYDGKNLWVTSSGKFSKIDPLDGTVIDSYSLPKSPEGIFFDGRYLWITERINDKIYVSTQDGEIFGVLPSPSPYPTGIVREGNYLYLLDFQERTLYKIDISYNEEPYYLGEKHKRKVSYYHSLCNKGPSSEVFGKIYLSYPEEDKHQKFLSPLKFNKERFEIKKDKWDEKFAYLEGRILNDQCLEFSYSVDVETSDLNYFILPEWVKNLEEIPKEIKEKYTIDGSKLDLANEFLKDLLKKIIGEEKNPFWIAFKIHKYLHTNLSYERTGGWNKAPTVLKRGNGSCSEFTFSFIALARAAGLPARYEAGIVVRGDDGSIDDVFHRWAQVYIPPFGWIPVDPSKGKPATSVDIVNSFGSLSNRFFITTHSGGDSEFLLWTYNSNHFYEYKGEAEIISFTEAKWEQMK